LQLTLYIELCDRTAESAVLSGIDPAASAEPAVKAPSVAIAGSKYYITMSENLLELLKAA
jgi:hypothetical protein